MYNWEENNTGRLHYVPTEVSDNGFMIDFSVSKMQPIFVKWFNWQFIPVSHPFNETKEYVWLYKCITILPSKDLPALSKWGEESIAFFI